MRGEEEEVVSEGGEVVVVDEEEAVVVDGNLIDAVEVIRGEFIFTVFYSQIFVILLFEIVQHGAAIGLIFSFVIQKIFQNIQISKANN